MPTITLLLLLSLTTWRITCDFTQEQGPFGLFHWLRTRVKGWAEEKINASTVNDPQDHPWYWLFDGITCFVCISFWLAGILTLLPFLDIALSRVNLANNLVRQLGLHNPLLAYFICWLSVAALARFFDAIYTRIIWGKRK